MAAPFLAPVVKPNPLPNSRVPAGVGAGHRGARHFKKSRAVLCEGVPVRYAFIRDSRQRLSRDPFMRGPRCQSQRLLCLAVGL